MPTIKAVISDADGTLVDTLHLIRHGQYETAKRYLLEYGIPKDALPSFEIYEEHLHKVLGGSARETLERTVRLLYQDSPESLAGMDFDRLHDLLDPVQDDLAGYVKPLPGLVDMLNGLGGAGTCLAVFTSGTPHHIVRNFGVALPVLGLSQYFRAESPTPREKMRVLERKIENHFNIPKVIFVTCEDISANKPDPESIYVALDRLAIQKSEAIILGDHWVDMEAGRNAGIAIRVGVSHGFDSKEALREAGATLVIPSLKEVPAIVASERS